MAADPWDRVAEILGVAAAAAPAVFDEGLVGVQAVVINVAWRAPDGTQWVAGSRVPDTAPLELAESLEQSADEVRAL
jgi:hypothetical protein